MSRPTVRIVIPCYNYGRFVADAVRSALDQQDADVDVVVVNDGSTDADSAAACDAAAALAPDRVRVMHQPNKGLPGARNAGASGATAEFLAFLDADDTLMPTFCSDLVRAIRDEEAAGRDEDVSHAYGQQVLSELGHGTWRVPDWDPLLLMITNLHPPTALIRRERFEAIGGYNESMREGYEDWDFWLSCAERGWRGVRVRKPVYTWRRHSHDTMIHRAVKIHGELYARIIAQHHQLFERRWADALVRANLLLRDAEANWLDEDLRAIPIRDLRRWTETLVKERDAITAAHAAASSEAALLRARVAELEAKPSLRASRAFHRTLDRMPGVIAGPVRGLLRAVKKAAPHGRG